MKKPLVWIVAIAGLYALHQDLWFWRSATPLLAGFLPIGLTYHALYCVAASALMWALTKYAWPSQLDPDPRANPNTEDVRGRAPQGALAGPPSRERFGASAVALAEAEAERGSRGPRQRRRWGVRRGEAPRS